MVDNLIVSIIIMTIILLICLYLLSTKNLNIIASIDSNKIPKGKKNKVIYVAVICILLSTLILIVGIFINNFLYSVLFIIASLICLLMFYIYYLMIIK
jgi:hypothetical protein